MKKVTLAFFLLATGFSVYASDGEMPSYMQNRIYFYEHDYPQDETIIVPIIGALDDDSLIDELFLNDDELKIRNFSLKLISLPIADHFTPRLLEDRNFIVFVKKGQCKIYINGKTTLLNEFDTIAFSSVKIDFYGDQKDSLCELIFISFMYQGQRSDDYNITRFTSLKSIKEQSVINTLLSHVPNLPWIDPKEQFDIIYNELSPDQIYPIAGKSHNIFAPNYEINDFYHLIFVVVESSINTGAAMHVHQKSEEIFVVLKGEVKVSHGDEAEYSHILSEGDVIAFPPSINRGFTFLTDDTAMIAINIGNFYNETDDISWLPHIKEEIIDKGASQLILPLASALAGMTFSKREDMKFPYGDLTLQ